MNMLIFRFCPRDRAPLKRGSHHSQARPRARNTRYPFANFIAFYRIYNLNSRLEVFQTCVC